MPIDFEWDLEKSALNVERHGLSFEVATNVFLDPFVCVVDTSRKEDNEERRKAIGRLGTRLFTVVFTKRDNAIRFISARRANLNEERSYGTRSLSP